MNTDLQSGDAPVTSTKHDATVIPVIEEQLQVGKRLVASGAVRVRKLVHEDVHAFDESLSVESTDVERVAIDLPLESAVEVRYEGDVMIIPVVEERIVTRKQLFLVEEIRIRRRTQTKSEALETTLRREEVVIERLDPVSGAWFRVDQEGGPLPEFL